LPRWFVISPQHSLGRWIGVNPESIVFDSVVRTASPDYPICSVDSDSGSFIRAFKDALRTGKSFYTDESEGTELLRRLSRPGIPGDGGMGLSAQLAFFEVRALVFFMSRRDFTRKRRLPI
jgi:hypothetical protein